MKTARLSAVNSPRILPVLFLVVSGFCLITLGELSALANEKQGMPDLSQVEQTCLPTSTANLLIWFGKHGYPKLIMAGADDDERALHTVHRIMSDTDARFDWGTRPDEVAVGIEKYIHDAGYSCDVEFRGLGRTSFTQDWLKENDDPNKGFILLLAYCAYDQDSNTFTNAWDAGHAVTLVNAQPDMILVHDPAHEDDEPGRKILTPQTLTNGMWESRDGEKTPVAGLLLLSGSLLEAPPNAGVMLIGAVCITMHPVEKGDAASGSASTTSGNIGAGSSSGNSAPSNAPVSTSSSWVMWLFDLFFKK